MLKQLTSLIVLFTFFFNSVGPMTVAHADMSLNLPAPGSMVQLSPNFEPALIKGITVHQDNPFLFDFIVDPGQSHLSSDALKEESNRMIRYFFASLTLPDKDIWVNLSPYEKDRMVPQGLGVTLMGRDLLAQDYMLKQITASLIYPQSALGKTFWDKVYAQAKAKYGTTQIPVNTFNKVWIVPASAGVYEHGQTAYIVEGRLKVMLEEDYLSLKKHNAISQSVIPSHSIGSQVIRQIVLPEIEREVNDGKNFSTLKQIFYAQILAEWFKRNLKQALLNKVYANHGTVRGIDQNNEATNEFIYHRYISAYKKGVFNYISEDIDPVTQEALPRKYFSGGVDGAQLAKMPIMAAALTSDDRAAIADTDDDIEVLAARPQDAAMMEEGFSGDESAQDLEDSLAVMNQLRARLSVPAGPLPSATEEFLGEMVKDIVTLKGAERERFWSTWEAEGGWLGIKLDKVLARVQTTVPVIKEEFVKAKKAFEAKQEARQKAKVTRKRVSVGVLGVALLLFIFRAPILAHFFPTHSQLGSTHYEQTIGNYKFTADYSTENVANYKVYDLNHNQALKYERQGDWYQGDQYNNPEWNDSDSGKHVYVNVPGFDNFLDTINKEFTFAADHSNGPTVYKAYAADGHLEYMRHGDWYQGDQYNNPEWYDYDSGKKVYVEVSGFNDFLDTGKNGVDQNTSNSQAMLSARSKALLAASLLIPSAVAQQKTTVLEKIQTWDNHLASPKREHAEFAYSKEGYPLKGITTVEFIFSPDDAKKKFRPRILPFGHHGDEKITLAPKAYTINAKGIVDVPFSVFKADDYEKAIEFVATSGNTSFGMQLNKNGAIASLLKIKLISGSVNQTDLTKLREDINAQLQHLDIEDPGAAHRSAAFNNIKNMGEKYYPALKAIVLEDRKKLTGNQLKWAAYFAANLAPTIGEAKSFVDQLAAFESYVREEAHNGLNDRAMRTLDRRTFLRGLLNAALLPFAASLSASCKTASKVSGESSAIQETSTPESTATESAVAEDPYVEWMLYNIFEDGMPRSFEVPKGTPDQLKEFWSKIGGDNVEGIIERIMVNDSLSVYDGAVWAAILALTGGDKNLKAASTYVQTLHSGHWGELNDIRGAAAPFKYQGKELDSLNAYFFRTLSPRWQQKDPKTGKDHFKGYPGPNYDHDLIIWPDWKPVTGENAWVILGALQVAKAKYGDNVPEDSDELKLALSLIAPIKALTTEIGGILHAPEGTAGKSPYDISNENNASAYAALTMLYQITHDQQYKVMADNIKEYIKKYGRDAEQKVLYQGGSYKEGKFTPYKNPFAVDVQTWSILSFSPAALDEMFEQGAAYQMWKETKTRAGYSQDGVLYGVGYTDGHDIFSGEWTAGAVAACLELYLYYKTSHPDWAKEALADAVSMMKGLEALSQKNGNRKSYLYANKRYAIPFGWNANAVPSTASTGWVKALATGKNFFRLGGDSTWLSIPEFKAVVDEINGGSVNSSLKKQEPTKTATAAPIVLPAAQRYSSSEYQAQSVYYLFDGQPVHVTEGEPLTFTITLSGVQSPINARIQLLPVGSSETTSDGSSDSIVLKPGENKITIKAPQSGDVKRIAVQYGVNDADGKIVGDYGGSMQATVTVKSVERGGSDQAMVGTVNWFDVYHDLLYTHFTGIGILSAAIIKSTQDFKKGKRSQDIDEKIRYYKAFKNDIGHIIGAVSIVITGTILAGMKGMNIDDLNLDALGIGTGMKIGGGIKGFRAFANQLVQDAENAKANGKGASDEKLIATENFTNNPWRQFFFNWTDWPMMGFLFTVAIFKPIPQAWNPVAMRHFVDTVKSTKTHLEYILPAVPVVIGALIGAGMATRLDKEKPSARNAAMITPSKVVAAAGLALLAAAHASAQQISNFSVDVPLHVVGSEVIKDTIRVNNGNLTLVVSNATAPLYTLKIDMNTGIVDGKSDMGPIERWNALVDMYSRLQDAILYLPPDSPQIKSLVDSLQEIRWQLLEGIEISTPAMQDINREGVLIHSITVHKGVLKFLSNSGVIFSADFNGTFFNQDGSPTELYPGSNGAFYLNKKIAYLEQLARDEELRRGGEFNAIQIRFIIKELERWRINRMKTINVYGVSRTVYHISVSAPNILQVESPSGDGYSFNILSEGIRYGNHPFHLPGAPAWQDDRQGLQKLLQWYRKEMGIIEGPDPVKRFIDLVQSWEPTPSAFNQGTWPVATMDTFKVYKAPSKNVWSSPAGFASWTVHTDNLPFGQQGIKNLVIQTDGPEGTKVKVRIDDGDPKRDGMLENDYTVGQNGEITVPGDDLPSNVIPKRVIVYSGNNAELGLNEPQVKVQSDEYRGYSKSVVPGTYSVLHNDAIAPIAIQGPSVALTQSARQTTLLQNALKGVKSVAFPDPDHLNVIQVAFEKPVLSGDTVKLVLTDTQGNFPTDVVLSFKDENGTETHTEKLPVKNGTVTFTASKAVGNNATSLTVTGIGSFGFNNYTNPESVKRNNHSDQPDPKDGPFVAVGVDKAMIDLWSLSLGKKEDVEDGFRSEISALHGISGSLLVFRKRNSNITRIEIWSDSEVLYEATTDKTPNELSGQDALNILRHHVAASPAMTAEDINGEKAKALKALKEISDSEKEKIRSIYNDWHGFAWNAYEQGGEAIQELLLAAHQEVQNAVRAKGLDTSDLAMNIRKIDSLNELGPKQKNVEGGIDLSQVDAAMHISRDANGGVKIDVDPGLEAAVLRDGMTMVVPVIVGMRKLDPQVLLGASPI